MEDGRKYRVDGMEIWIQLMEVKNKLNIVIGILVMCLILILYLGFKLGTQTSIGRYEVQVLIRFRDWFVNKYPVHVLTILLWWGRFKVWFVIFCIVYALGSVLNIIYPQKGIEMDERNELIEAVKRLEGELDRANERIKAIFVLSLLMYGLLFYIVHLIRT